MKKILLFILMILPVAVMGQNTGSITDNITPGQLYAIDAILKKLPCKDSLRYITSENDTIWEKKDAAKFLYEVAYRAYKENTVTNICGIEFGSSLTDAKNLLENKFGETIYCTEDVIMYENKSYGGNRFDLIIFTFQSDRHKSYLNQVAFAKYAKDKEEAIQIKNNFHHKLLRKYPSVREIDEEMSVGGLPPILKNGNSEIYTGITTAEMGFGFEIKIVKQDNYEYPFLVRIMYGPYEYVKEDF